MGIGTSIFLIAVGAILRFAVHVSATGFSIHTIGVILMMAPRALTTTFSRPPPEWNVDPVADQAVAGALAWSYGEPIALATVLLFAVRWRRDEQSESTWREADTASSDAELAAYNAFLRGLHEGAPRAREGSDGAPDR